MTYVPAEFTQMQQKPKKTNTKGEITQEPYATITIKVNLMEKKNREAISDLLQLMTQDNVYFSILSEQALLLKTEEQVEFEEGDGEETSASLSQDEAEAQINYITEAVEEAAS